MGEEIKDKVKELEEQLAQETEAKLMARADLENYRKRMEVERGDAVVIANMAILKAIIEVIDDFERMVNDLDEKGKEDKIDAFKPVLDKTKGILVDYGVTEIELGKGDMLNPETMEAIGTVAVDEDEHNKIIDITRKGYQLRDQGRVVRHAQVIVGKKKN